MPGKELSTTEKGRVVQRQEKWVLRVHAQVQAGPAEEMRAGEMERNTSRTFLLTQVENKEKCEEVEDTECSLVPGQVGVHPPRA